MTTLSAGTILPRMSLRKASILASLLFHAALAIVIVLGVDPRQTAARPEPASIDIVSIEELLPPVATPIAASEAPLVAAAVEPLAPPPDAAEPQPAPAPAEAPEFAATPGAPVEEGRGMALPTRVVAVGAQTGPAQGSGGGAEPEYVAQFRITGVPVVPEKAVLSKIEYPPLAAKQGVEATVYLELFIDAEGRIRNIIVLKDPGYGFAEAAKVALKGVACAPATIDGKPVAVRFRYPIRFALK